MDLLHTGYNELIFIQTPKISLSIKGKSNSITSQYLSIKNNESCLKVFCNDLFDISLDRDASSVYEGNKGTQHIAQYYSVPIFFEQQQYELVIESNTDDTVTFWHDNFNIRNKITPVGRSNKILSGMINFGNDIGMSDIIVLVNNKEYLRLTVEVFPSKISYKEDYKAMISDITDEIYNLIFDMLKKTYLEYNQTDTISNSSVEFFSVITKIYDNFIRAADIILSHPHHKLITVHEVLPSHKIKHIDKSSIRWLEKHPNQISTANGQFNVQRSMAVKKELTYDTAENRFVKYILKSASLHLMRFRKQYISSSYNIDNFIVSKIDKMIEGIEQRCNIGILSEITAHESSCGISLIFSMASGYKDIYKMYLMLLHGLSVSGDIFKISVKDLAILYEYWCFIKLNSIMRKSTKYTLISQDIVKVKGNGLFISLAKGKSSNVKYRNTSTQELITLSYNPKEINVPTVAQKPDNVLTLEKKGSSINYEYVFDAKYRINPAVPGSSYYTTISHYPGPETDDINTMHRYRDSIVYQNGASPFERTMFGAYVLFPYSNEEEYKSHRFFKSIDKVNIGGLPFLPSATTMVEDMLDQLISDSPDSAFERTTLPNGIEEKLKKVDWNNRDVLIGTLKNKEQLDICLQNKFYHIPAFRLKDSDFPIHYVALYKSKRLFGSESGITYYGEVTKVIPTTRRSITEIPKDSNELYYRFEIKEWKKLSKNIEAKELGFVKSFTNLFLLTHSTEIPELWIRSEEEYRLYSELKRTLNDISINDSNDSLSFKFNNYLISFESGKILISKGRDIISQHNISTFSKSPNAVFRQIQQEISL